MVYLEFFKKSFQRQTAYRANSTIRIFGAFVGIFISINVWVALYQDSTTVNGIEIQDMIRYITLNALVSSVSSCSIGTFIANKVRDGSIIVDFIRPVNFKVYIYSEQLGQNVYSLLFHTILPCIVVSLIYSFGLPGSAALLAFFLAAVLFGVVLNFQIEYVVGLLAFWFKTSFYADWLLRALRTLFVGSFVPLWFYPDILYRISAWMPFRFIVFEPISLYLGKVPQGEEINILLMQFVWIVVLVALEKFMWIRIQKKIVIQGG